MSFVSELRRRNVFRAGIAYVVVAWLVLQIADVILPNVGAPDWLFRILLMLLAIGLPVVLVIAWIFELTPSGIKRDADIDGSELAGGGMGRQIDFAIIAILVVALGYFAYDKFVLSKVELDKSIAVLPFANMSQDAEQEYFADGLSEELLNLLAKIPALRVIARTSSFTYKGREDATIAQISRELNVDHVLEGSVRKDSGSKVRITAQLIRAKDESHLWSDTYDVTLDDVFAVQDNIAAAVVEELKVKLLGAIPTADEIDAKAFSLYLQARELGRHSTKEGQEEAINLYEQVLAIDPEYPPAWVGLAESLIFLTEKTLRPTEEGFTEARAAANKALAIDPDYAPALASLGRISMVHDNDMPVAARQLERALQLDPSNPVIIRQAAILLANLHRVEDAIRLLEFAVARDPASAAIHSNLGLNYFFARRLDESVAEYRSALKLSPKASGYHSWIGAAFALKNEHAAALAEIEQEPEEPWRLLALVTAYHAAGQSAESDQALEEMIDKYGQEWPYNVAYVIAYRGEADRGFEWLDKAKEIKDPGLSEIVSEPLFDKLRSDPRWPKFIASVGKTQQELDAIKFKIPRLN